MKADLKGKLSVSTLYSSVFFVTGILLTVDAYFEHLHYLDIVRNNKFGFSSGSIDYGADRLLRYAFIAACLAIVMSLARLRRSTWFVLVNAGVFILLSMQCFVVVRMEYRSQLLDTFRSWMHLAASVLLAGSAIAGGAGSIIRSIRQKVSN